MLGTELAIHAIPQAWALASLSVLQTTLPRTIPHNPRARECTSIARRYSACHKLPLACQLALDDGTVELLSTCRKRCMADMRAPLAVYPGTACLCGSRCSATWVKSTGRLEDLVGRGVAP